MCGRIVEHVEEGPFRIVNVEIGPEVAFGNEARVCRNPGLPGYSADGREIILLPGSDDDPHGYQLFSLTLTLRTVTGQGYFQSLTIAGHLRNLWVISHFTSGDV